MGAFRLRVAAERDLLDLAIEGHSRWGDDVMRRYVTALDAVFHTLAESPHLGRACPEIRPGVRRLQQGSHMAYYRLTDDGVVDILRILHERMLPAGQLRH